MAIETNLVPVPDLVGRVVNPNQIQLGEAAPQNFNINQDGDIRARSAYIRTCSYTILGLTETEVIQLTNVAENNIRSQIRNQPPTYRDIRISGQTYEDCYLVKVTPSGSITVDGIQIAEQVVAVYESRKRYVT